LYVLLTAWVVSCIDNSFEKNYYPQNIQLRHILPILVFLIGAIVALSHSVCFHAVEHLVDSVEMAEEEALKETSSGTGQDIWLPEIGWQEYLLAGKRDGTFPAFYCEDRTISA